MVDTELILQFLCWLYVGEEKTKQGEFDMVATAITREKTKIFHTFDIFVMIIRSGLMISYFYGNLSSFNWMIYISIMSYLVNVFPALIKCKDKMPLLFALVFMIQLYEFVLFYMGIYNIMSLFSYLFHTWFLQTFFKEIHF